MLVAVDKRYPEAHLSSEDLEVLRDIFTKMTKKLSVYNWQKLKASFCRGGPSSSS